MKSFCFFLLLSGWLTANAQAIGVFAGRNGFPSDYIALQYFHPSNYPLQLAAQVFAEGSRRNGLRYVSYGTTVSLNYSSNQASTDKTTFSYRFGLGLQLQTEHESWVLGNRKEYATLPIGFAGEAAGEWALSSAFSLSLFIQQRWLLKQALGNRQFVFGLGLIYQLNNEY